MKFIASALLAASFITLTSAAPRYRRFSTDHKPMALVDLSSASEPARARVLSIINDDFDKARADANKGKLPLFVEVWAPW